MTEQEAKTKWCPHAVASHTDPRKRIGDGWLHACIGSACMAWRTTTADDWADQFKKLIQGGFVIDAIKLHRTATNSGLKESKDFVDGVRAGTIPMPVSQAVGYCGLAGKP